MAQNIVLKAADSLSDKKPCLFGLCSLRSSAVSFGLHPPACLAAARSSSHPRNSDELGASPNALEGKVAFPDLNSRAMNRQAGLL